ncbi:MAG: GNAT family N-acetyltransferase [Pseudomonas sp.]|uniref:GNAT family N-acetyltransferase n=1 Tax=Pseudomonas abieticivorans TaxID=2931382 RepID=UPI0020C16539|nr:GNAT family N-acetyltransferase [Pseudomonas sp. PIA16]MDE1164561.1 GNAT family N-acetyltransferase [Pseudomonas sp.]
MHSPDIVITPVSHPDIAATQAFIMEARAQLFPLLDPSVLPADLAAFASTYLAPGRGRFLIARAHGDIVAGIGYLPYDHRFEQLDYQGQRVVEVVRLFVSPALRRCGLAARLYQAIKGLALQDGIEVLYLHTHPFLPGAIDFWHKQGLQTVDVEADPVWQTTHMHWRA